MTQGRGEAAGRKVYDCGWYEFDQKQYSVLCDQAREELIRWAKENNPDLLNKTIPLFLGNDIEPYIYDGTPR